MSQAVKKRVRVQANGVVTVQDASLPEGAEAEVTVLLTDAGGVSDTPPPLPLSKIVGSGKGGFSSVEEIDLYIRDLRDEWD